MTCRKLSRWTLAALCAAALAPPLRAQPVPPEADAALQTARQAAERGDPAAAEAAYSRVLATQPHHLDALVGRANARAFQKKYALAKEDFNVALALRADHVGALIGLGHTLAWAGQHEEALTRFDAVLRAVPDHVDAQRGAAYAELWRGRSTAAIERFERLLAQAPQDSGAREGLAQARAALADSGTRYELGLWLGRTSLPAGQRETGLRFAEFAIWPQPALRLFVRYDDGLSRDNAAVARSDRNAALRSGGGYLRWNQRLGTLIELGSRNLPDGEDQTTYHVEQAYYADGGHEAKAGATYGPRSDSREEWLAYLGAGVAMSPGWRLEPMVYFSRNGLPGGRETRLALTTLHNLGNGWEAAGGLALGSARSDGRSRDVRDGHARVSYQIHPRARLQLLARRESVQGGDGITVVSLGSTFNWR